MGVSRLRPFAVLTTCLNLEGDGPPSAVMMVLDGLTRGSGKAIRPSSYFTDLPVRELVRKIFLVGGASFNSIKESAERSRRIELKLDFREVGDAHEELADPPWDDDPRCPLDPEKSVS